jgi:hypothetical protein
MRRDFASIILTHLPGGFATVLGSIELPAAVIIARTILGESVQDEGSFFE